MATGRAQTLASNGADQNCSITIVCPLHGDHGPYVFNGQHNLIINNSKVLGNELNTHQHDIRLGYSHCEYDCCTLQTILRTWRNQEFSPFLNNNTFAALYQLSKALWEYQCRPNWFQGFAIEIRDRYWKTDFKYGDNSDTWAFIALVFGWEDVFALASMDVPSLGIQPRLNEASYQEMQIARIVGERDYTDQFSATYDFVRNSCGELPNKNQQVFDRLLKRFKEKDIIITSDQEANIRTLRPLGIVGLLRMFESFLEQDAQLPKPRGTTLGNRLHRPLLSRMVSSIKHKRNSQAAEPTSIQDSLDPTERDLLSYIKEHREFSLSRFLERNRDAGQRFRNLRSDNLLLDARNTWLPQIPPVGSFHRELDGAQRELHNQTAPGSPRYSGYFHTPGCFQYPSCIHSPGSLYSPESFRTSCTCRPATPPPS
ncbi:hypothetical protein GJ744_001654 [Endocarpon pusillum]|uniref:Uncharacterized protein n=1 Tax=Endocarpon pusillum TaxID=364733 RepID=A0A8H7AD00_9EURO|nr:hypothetical protein GJ744_001654 [Endocarpon pusillum]